MTKPARRPIPRAHKFLIAAVACVTVFGYGGYAYYRCDSLRVNDAIAGGDLDEMNALLDRDPGRLERRPHTNLTPLLTAAKYGNVRALDALLRRGADIHARYSEVGIDGEWTALHLTAYNGHADATLFLIRAGADVNAVSAYGHTPLDLATGPGNERTVLMLHVNGGVGGKQLR